MSAESKQWAMTIARPGPTDGFNYYCDRLLQRERQAVGNLVNYCRHEARRWKIIFIGFTKSDSWDSQNQFPRTPKISLLRLREKRFLGHTKSDLEDTENVFHGIHKIGFLGNRESFS